MPTGQLWVRLSKAGWWSSIRSGQKGGGEGLAVPPFVSTGQVMEISRWSVGRGSRGRAVRQASLPVGLEC